MTSCQGQRFGEMERDITISHGAAGFIREMLDKTSDEIPFIYCQRCNLITEHNNFGQCRYCGGQCSYVNMNN